MNILFLFTYPIIPNIGGVQRVTDLLSKEFVKRGHKVFYLSLTKPMNNYNDYSCPQEFIDEVYVNKKLALSRFNEILTRRSIDIVICQEMRRESLFLLKNRRANIKIITVIHYKPFPYKHYMKRIKKNVHYKNYFKNAINKLLIVFPFIAKIRYTITEKRQLKEFLEVSDKFCLLSERYIPIIKKYIGDYSDKLVAIGNPNTFKIVNPVNFNCKRNIILYVGRLAEVPKNIHDFIDVWRILSVRNKDWEAYIIGDGPDRNFLENYARSKQINRLFFMGNQQDMVRYYSEAKFICMTSICEGWGMVLTEAMSYGCIPCAYGTFEAVYDIIDNNVCGFITTPFKPEEMADKIQSLIDDDKLRDKFSSSAYQKVQNFNVEKIADKWEALFNSMS
jgi:glycosyltransferase involved in cell wall biosynthesis